MIRQSIYLGVTALLFISAIWIPAADANAKIVYSFCSQQNRTDGEVPFATLTDVKGTLFGTTADGGAHGNGTVYSLNPVTGAQHVVYSFRKVNDGRTSVAPLIAVDGMLFGTTEYGDDHACSPRSLGCGTVFSVNPATGAETVLHAFSGTDGQNPLAGLISVNGTLYGTTDLGGARGLGTVFSIDPATGTESLVYSFCSQQQCSDGKDPMSGLINVNGIFYGTTYVGGAGAGTVYSINPANSVETVIHSFIGPDGSMPETGLIDVNGTLYGTTSDGGAYSGGTVFEIDVATGEETVLYSFCAEQKCSDGETPHSGVIDVGGVLYGTTEYPGGGKLYALNLATGTESVLQGFRSDSNLGSPPTGVINKGNRLYGTTSRGGPGGGGVVFSLKH